MEKACNPPIPILVRLCSDRVAFEVKPQRSLLFNLNEVRQLTEVMRNYEVLADTPYILVLRSKTGAEITFSENGRMIVRNVLTEAEATRVAHDILNAAVKTLKLR